ncbi:MAG TPA: DUF4097 family beta strand repeat-containing protein [Terriglobia bacterium]|jgi:hypothetical protein
MRRILSTILVLAASMAALPAHAQERMTVKFNDPSRPGLLKVQWHNGSIAVKTHSGGDITIAAKRGLNTRPEPPEAGGLHRIDSPNRGIVVESDTNNVITISSGHTDFANGNLEIEVPVKTDLKLESHNGSLVSVDGVDGDIEATNHNGAINVVNASGSVVADSHNGRVVVSFREIAAGKPMSFTSWNGPVDVTLPAASKADLKLRTDNGAIYTDFDVQMKTGQAGSADKTITGSINGGGADFDLRTHNGNIYLRKAK